MGQEDSETVRSLRLQIESLQREIESHKASANAAYQQLDAQTDEIEACNREWEEANPYASLSTNGRFTLFVNSESDPEKEVPLDHYYYKSEDSNYNNITFFRLYRAFYLQTDDSGLGVMHSLYYWKQVKIKNHCIPALKLLIDGFLSVEEFIQQKPQLDNETCPPALRSKDFRDQWSSTKYQSSLHPDGSLTIETGEVSDGNAVTN